jgi:hypothetical protein
VEIESFASREVDGEISDGIIDWRFHIEDVETRVVVECEEKGTYVCDNRSYPPC